MNLIKKISMALCLSLALVYSTEATATGCMGMVNQVAIYPGGTLAVSWAGINNGNPVAWCSVSSNLGQYDTNACKSIYALFLAASLSGANVYVSFNGGNSCASLGGWPISGINAGPSLISP